MKNEIGPQGETGISFNETEEMLFVWGMLQQITHARHPKADSQEDRVLQRMREHRYQILVAEGDEEAYTFWDREDARGINDFEILKQVASAALVENQIHVSTHEVPEVRSFLEREAVKLEDFISKLG